MIPQEIRDELDQSPAWWLRLFHQALIDCGAERVVGDTVSVNFMNGEVVTYEYSGWVDCPCAGCRSIVDGWRF